MGANIFLEGKYKILMERIEKRNWMVGGMLSDFVVSASANKYWNLYACGAY